MNRFHRLLAALGIAAIALTACSGGGAGVSPHTSPNQGPASGQGLHNVAVPPASSRTTYGTAHLALTLPHVFTGRNAQAVRATKGLKPAATQRVHAAAGRSPTYVNPTCGECDNVIDLFVDGSLLTNLDGCAGSGDSVCVNTSSADGTQSINVPLFSSGTNDVVAVEWGPNGLLAIGETWIGSFTPGTPVNATLTMLMNAAYIGILDLRNQADAEVLTGQTYNGLGGSCGQSPQQAQFGLYSADASGTFVPIAGYGGTANPTLTSTPDAGGSTTTPQTTIPGVYLLNWDSNCDGATLHASAANPAYAIYASSTDFYGPRDGNGNETNGYLACFNKSGTCPGGPYQGLWNIYFEYSDEPYRPQLDLNAATVSGTADVVDVTPGQTLAYISQGTSGVSIRTEAGTQVGSIATSTSADFIALDDTGNVYDMTYPPRDGSGNPTGPGTISLYTPGLGGGYPAPYARSAVTYAPSNPNNLLSIAASGAGELVAFEGSVGGEVIDEWDPGQSGAPSRTFTVTNSGGAIIYFYFVGHDGSVYTASSVSCGQSSCIQFNVTPPGATTPTRTVSESIVPQGSQGSFSPNYVAVGPDGTIYVTEWSFSSPDPLAGLYIYPPSGPERYYSTGAEAPNGIDLDASGNIYVVNNNSAYNDTLTYSADTADNVAVLTPDGGTVLRRITGSFVEPYPVSVTPDGTAFIGDYVFPGIGNAGGTFLAAAGSTTAQELTPIAGNTVVSWNGSVETTSRARSVQSAGRGVSGHGGGLSLGVAAKLRRGIGNRSRR